MVNSLQTLIGSETWKSLKVTKYNKIENIYVSEFGALASFSDSSSATLPHPSSCHFLTTCASVSGGRD